MDPRSQEDPNIGPDHADAFIAGSESDPPPTNSITESAIVSYTESPLTTLRKRDLEYRRLNHANSPEQRDPEKRSRQLAAECSDEDMGSDAKSDISPSPAPEASESGPSDHSGSELSLEPRSSLEELPFWESNDDFSIPIRDLVEYHDTRQPVVTSVVTRESNVEESLVPSCFGLLLRLAYLTLAVSVGYGCASIRLVLSKF